MSQVTQLPHFPNEQPADFCTLGTVVIDDTSPLSPRAPSRNVLGGAGAFAALGARIVGPPPLSRRVGWIVDAGPGFPTSLREYIDDWDTSCHIRESTSRFTTRFLDAHDDFAGTTTKYPALKLSIEPSALSPALLTAKSFHLICSPMRCIELISELVELRDMFPEPPDMPLIVWEPTHDASVPDELYRMFEALAYVNVVSLTEDELREWFSADPSSNTLDASDSEGFRHFAYQWVDCGIGTLKKGVVIIRRGALGCSVFERHGNSQDYPAYHPMRRSTSDEVDHVTDTTGCGSTFLGALTMSLLQSEWKGTFDVCMDKAVKLAVVSAGVASEQLGMPRLSHEEHMDTWNGISMQSRVDAYEVKCQQQVRTVSRDA